MQQLHQVQHHTYLWNNGATTEDLTNLSAGTYTVTVTDANGCVEYAKAELSSVNGGMTASAVGTDAGCGLSDGSVDATITGGSAPYSYAWSNGSTNEDLAGVAAGVYTLIVTDANGCTANTIAIVNNGVDGPQVSATATDVSCSAQNSGSVTATVTGGAPLVVTRIYRNGGLVTIGTSVANAVAGTYTIEATDANGCKGYATAVVMEPATLVLTLDQIVNDSCNSFIGSITALMAE
ncbi:MAG: SprB repeat-containing protein [Bacteroidetes bacterium]|nr:SprB repeat-containing protein [Bacteroidota bacterium]